MATSITPKSEIRMNDNIIVGYGEVPTAQKEEKVGWALPGNRITFCKEEAFAAASQLDQIIRSAMNGSPAHISTFN